MSDVDFGSLADNRRTAAHCCQLLWPTFRQQGCALRV